MRIASSLFQHQHAFLEHGPGHLVPLRMGDLAQELGLHISTVSRGVAGKYAQTPWGILPLRHFFQGAAGADEDSARDDVLRAGQEEWIGRSVEVLVDEAPAPAPGGGTVAVARAAMDAPEVDPVVLVRDADVRVGERLSARVDAVDAVANLVARTEGVQ